MTFSFKSCSSARNQVHRLRRNFNSVWSHIHFNFA